MFINSLKNAKVIDCYRVKVRDSSLRSEWQLIYGQQVSGENFTGKILTANLPDQNQIVIPNEVRDLSGLIINTLHNVVISSAARDLYDYK